MPSTIRERVLSQALFDGHEHVHPLPEFAGARETYASIGGYALADLRVAGGPASPAQEATDVAVLDPAAYFAAWRRARNTGYCRAIERACRDLLGIDYTEENAGLIGERLNALKDPDPTAFYCEVLAKRAGIRWAIKDNISSPEGVAEGQYPHDLVRVNYRDDELLTIASVDQILGRERRWNRSIHSLDDLVDGLRESMAACFTTGWVTAVKIGVAYRRKLDFSNASKADAERAFNRLMMRGSGRPAGSLSAALASDAELRPLHDWLVHQFIRLATDADRTVQVHTGYLAGVNNDLRNINPVDLVPLILTYRTTRFELFHAGWPYHDLLGTMGKHYPNVWVSMVWAWAMNPVTTERALDAWLDGVPHNKIIAFGGDTTHPVCTYGYAVQAREGVARVLESRLARGVMDDALAGEVARAILLTNGCELHRLPAD
jgi:hypothetical protein